MRWKVWDPLYSVPFVASMLVVGATVSMRNWFDVRAPSVLFALSTE